MRLTVVALTVAVAAVALPASASPSRTLSDPRVAPAACADRLEASTGDIAVRGRQLVASWSVGDDAATGLAVSNDRGRTFTRSVVAGLTACAGNGPLRATVDPDLALGADGTTWVSGSGNPVVAEPAVVTGDADNRLYVKVGKGPAVSVVTGSAAQRGFLEPDPVYPGKGVVLTEQITSASIVAGPVAYGIFIPGAPQSSLLAAVTADRGRTWASTVVRRSAPGHSILALGLVRARGALIALSVDVDVSDPAVLQGLVTGNAPGTIASQRSLDGGRNWSAPVVLGTVRQSTLGDAAAGGGVVAFAAAQTDGALAVWTSRDAGQRWTQTIASRGVLQPSTGVAVDDRGRVGVLSYAKNGDLVTPQVSTSKDGRTWDGPHALGRPFSLTTNAGSGHVAPLGAYQGGAGDGHQLVFAYTAGESGHTLVRLARLV